VEVVDKLLSTGASVDMQDKQGETALHLAARVGNVEVVSKLISAGASVDMQDNFQRTAFVLGSKKQ
jgi:ankyrin repeat protein